MGRITPRKRKTTRIYMPMLRTWLNVSARLKPDTEREAAATPEEAETQQPAVEQGKGQAIKALLLKIWHAPDAFHWMEPLPNFHRRWVIIIGALLLLALLWPYSPETGSQDTLAGNQQHTPQQEPPQGGDATAQPEQGNWLSYQIQPGQTLAQLFRDNSLPVNDVFAMAQVEGDDKPLSNLKAGQEVRIARDAAGMVAALSITTVDNRQITFQRQPDGSYRSAR